MVSRRFDGARGAARLLTCAIALAGCNALIGLHEGKDRPGAGGGGGEGGAGGGMPMACSNGMKDEGETGKDCGGLCSPCAAGGGCKVGPDCESKVCSGGTCVVAACDDKIQNGIETDLDCGGACPKCGPTKGCAGDEDCKSNSCVSAACVSTCVDMVKGGIETDLDCGGVGSTCPPCVDGKICAIAGDCQSEVCEASSCRPNHLWSKHFVALGATNQLDPVGIAVVEAGNVVFAGNLIGAASFEGAPLTGSGTGAIVLAKFDTSGAYVWATSLVDNPPSGFSARLGASSSGDMVVAGSFAGTLILGGKTLTSAGSNDAYVAKIDTLGAPIWRKRFGDANHQYVDAIAVDKSGNVALQGGFAGTIDFGGGALMSVGGFDTFVCKLDTSGNQLWSKRFNDSMGQAFGFLAFAGSGELVFGGTFYGTIGMGGAPLVSAGDQDLFMSKYDTSGNHLWSRRFGSAAFDDMKAMTVDSLGNMIIAGSFAGTIDLGGGAMTATSGLDAYVAKFDASGAYLWARSFGGQGTQVVSAMAADSAGNLVLTGGFEGTIDFGGGARTSAGGTDIYLAKLDATGKHVWSRRIGGVQDERGRGMAIFDTKDVLIAGTFVGAFDAGGGLLTNEGKSDSFLAKFRLP